MATDDNFSYLSGELVDDPVIEFLKNNKKILCFSLRVKEGFDQPDGSRQYHTNIFPFKVFGKHVEKYADEMIPGRRYKVTGYLRADNSDGRSGIHVRVFNVQSDD